LKFGILSQWYDPEPGSAAVPGVLARALRGRGHDIQVVTGFPNYPTGELEPGYRMSRRTDEVTAEGIRIRRVALYPSHDRSPLRRAANYASFAISASASATSTLRGLDAVWVYNSPATVGLPSWLCSLRGGPPHLMHVVDLWPDSLLFSGLMSSRAYAVAEPLLEPWCEFTYRQAAEIAGISQGICDRLVARGVPGRKVHYVPLWADENLYRPRPRDEALAARLGVGQDFVLLYAGNLGDAQGLDGLLDVLTRVGDLSHFHCLIAGSGVAEARLRNRATQLRLGNVTFLGRWPAPDIGSLMSIGDVHLVSLADHPLTPITLPSKLPTTLASGRAVIACAVGEPVRVVTDARAGWAVLPNDPNAFEGALREAYALGREGITELGVNARRWYECKFSIARGVSSLESMLDAIATSDSANHPSPSRAELRRAGSQVFEKVPPRGASRAQGRSKPCG
jgi:colanic acid biosynthesis glycosyl transferase WcaI